jgi:hypothetical protein
MKRKGKGIDRVATIEYETLEKSLLDDVRGALDWVAKVAELEHGRADIVAERDALVEALRQLEALAPEDLAEAGRSWRGLVDACGSVSDVWAGRQQSAIVEDLSTREGRYRLGHLAMRLNYRRERSPPLEENLERYIHELGRRRAQELGGSEDPFDERLRGSALDLYSEGRAALWEAMAYMETEEYGDVLFALGQKGLPLPRVRDIMPNDPRQGEVGRPVRTYWRDSTKGIREDLGL